MEKVDVSVILPIESSKHFSFDEYFNKAVQSLLIQVNPINELIIVHSGEDQLKSKIESYDYSGLTVNIIQNDGDFDFSSQVNLGVQNAKSKWVSVLEFDDEYSSIWFKNVKEYITYYPDVQVFLPVVVDTDSKGGFAGFTNEATFAANFSQEMGYLTNETLHTYQNFQTAGAVFKKQILDDFGGFKSSIKLTFVYEFLLRLTYNSARIMTIPRLGYKHLNLREGSIFWNYKYSVDTLLEDEVKFWIQTAKKEYFFSEDRAIKYEGQTI